MPKHTIKIEDFDIVISHLLAKSTSSNRNKDLKLEVNLNSNIIGYMVTDTHGNSLHYNYISDAIDRYNELP